MGFDDDLADHRFFLGVEPEFIEAEEDFSAGEEAERCAFAVDGGDGGDADIDFFPFDADVDATVLGEALFGDVHAGHHLNAGEDGGLVAFELGGHRCLVQDSIDAVTDAEFVFGWFEVDICGAVFEGFPDDLVDELDDGGLLVALGDLLIFADEQFEGLIVLHAVEGFGADAVIFLEGFFDFGSGGEAEGDGALGVELEGAEQVDIEGVADGDFQGIVFEFCWQDEVLEGDFGGDAAGDFGADTEVWEVEVGEIDDG